MLSPEAAGTPVRPAAIITDPGREAPCLEHRALCDTKCHGETRGRAPERGVTVPCRPLLLPSLFLTPLQLTPAIVVRHDRDGARYRRATLLEQRGSIGVVEYRAAGPGLSSVRVRAEKYKEDIASTAVPDRRERDKISWLRVRALAG